MLIGCRASFRRAANVAAFCMQEPLEYDFEIIHRKGALHHTPDLLWMFKSNIEVSTKSIFGHYREGKTFLRHGESWYRKCFQEISSNEKSKIFAD